MYLIVDSFNLAFRSHYAFNTLTNSAGLQSGCFYGFLTGLRSIKNKYPQYHIILAWDTESVRRKQVFAEYKANRNHATGIHGQIDDLKKMFYNLNVSQVSYQGEEADDVIASLVNFYSNDQIIIYSSDKDLLQLVKDGRVVVLNPKGTCYDEEKVKQEFGVYPKDFVCYQCLRGDSVDGVPGVARLRSSKIAQLASTYKNIQDVYENIDKESLTDFERCSIMESKQQILLNDQLVRLRGDLELQIIHGVPEPALVEIYLNKYEISKIKSDSYVSVFKDISSFNMRKTEALKTTSFF